MQFKFLKINLHYILNINNLLYVVLEVKNMKSKSLINIALIGASCIAVSVSFVVGSKAHQDDFSLVHSQESEYRIVLNKNTLYQVGCYIGDSTSLYKGYIFFPLTNSGNYTLLNDYTDGSQAVFGGDHLYSQNINTLNRRYCVMIDVIGHRNKDYYFDAEHTQKIKLPGFDTLTKIEVTFNSESDIQMERTPKYKYDIVQDGNKWTITKGSKIDSESYAFLDFNCTQEDIDNNRKVIVDEIALTYTCGNA